MGTAHKVTGAVAQVAAEFMNTRANLAKAIKAIEDAAREGAEIVAFAENFLGQYPYWAQFYEVKPRHWAKVVDGLYETAITVGGDECRALSAAARRHKIHVIMGCNELSNEPGSATIYNAQLFFDKEGNLRGRHRKLMPTYHERMVHGQGDGRDLRVYKTDIGNVGMLICWEHHITLAKAAMTAMGEEIHVANWPGLWRFGEGEERLVEAGTFPYTCDSLTAIREYATETGNFVLSASGYLPLENISDEWKEAIGNSLNADWAIGGSAIVAPGGGYLVEPVVSQEKILVAEMDFAARRRWKAFFDPMGHYSRPDVLSLLVNDPDGRERIYNTGPGSIPIRDARDADMPTGLLGGAEPPRLDRPEMAP